MDGLRSVTYSETGTVSPYVVKDVKNPNPNPLGLELNKRIDDTSRIAQMLVDKPGLKFAGNQALLNASEIARKTKAAADKKRNQKGGATNAGVLLAGAQGGLDATIVAAGQVLKIVGSTLAQVPVNGTGTHFVRGFTPDTYIKSGDPNGLLGFLGFDGESGATRALQGAKIIPDGNPQEGLESFPIDDTYRISRNNPDNPKELGLGDTSKNKYKNTPKLEQSLFSGKYTFTHNDDYVNIQGDPSVIVKAGGTIGQDNTGQSDYKPLHESNLQTSSSIFSNTTVTKTLDKSVSISSLEELNGGTANTERTTTLIDYRKLKEKGYRSNTYSFNYSGEGSDKVIKETRVGLGNQGKKKGKIANYTDTDEDRQDKVNSLDVKKDIPSPQADPDFVQLSFEIITPENTYFIQFRAFLETFSDTFSAEWGTTKYIGRAEDFYTYNGFSRQVSIGFKIAAATRSEMLPIYNKINTLASVTALTYGGTESKFMRGTIARVTVGDYLYNVPGIIDSVAYSWQKEYPWEINAPLPTSGKEDTMPVLPHILDCSLSFKPIHDFVPESGLTTFISNKPKKVKEVSKLEPIVNALANIKASDLIF